MIVFLSVKNNSENISRERQRINNQAWDRTQKQKWEIKCALEERNRRKSFNTSKPCHENLNEQKNKQLYVETDL